MILYSILGFPDALPANLLHRQLLELNLMVDTEIIELAFSVSATLWRKINGMSRVAKCF